MFNTLLLFVRCNQKLHLGSLWQLKRQNLPVNCLDEIFDATVVSDLLYANSQSLLKMLAVLLSGDSLCHLTAGRVVSGWVKLD